MEFTPREKLFSKIDANAIIPLKSIDVCVC